MSGLPYLEAEELQVLFGYASLNSMYHSIARGNFPVSTYKVGRRIVADKEVVREFFATRREEGLAKLKNKT